MTRGRSPKGRASLINDDCANLTARAVESIGRGGIIDRPCQVYVRSYRHNTFAKINKHPGIAALAENTTTRTR